MTDSNAGHLVWVLSDTRPGHYTQLDGLLQALRRQGSLRTRIIEFPGRGPLAWLRALREPLHEPPNLLLAAGHRTHIPLLLLARRCGAPSVLLMRPSLPSSWFDLILAPAHDGLAESANVVVTQGVLNRARWSEGHDPGDGLILIGGPSAHHDWDEVGLLAQVGRVAQADAAVTWTLATSPRTPGGFAAHAQRHLGDRVKLVPFEDTTPDWLPSQLGRAGQVWVSADSVSMVYEALSCGAGVGVLEVPEKRDSRVSRGLNMLVTQGLVRSIGDWDGSPLAPPRVRFNEAERCAGVIRERFLQPGD